MLAGGPAGRIQKKGIDDMSTPVAHFAINADDLPRARRFYENVFGWKFSAWGPPGFYMIDMGAANPLPLFRGSLQQRRELAPGVRMTGFECTISVPDIQATAAAVEANGGVIVMQICTLAGIGRLLFFQDPEGNLAGAMQYDSKAE
jgi:predicted enzyme related to lactoylglutathione lyase